MGNGGVPPLLNGPHKVQMGWVSATSVSTNGVFTYTLTNLETKAGTQVLKIPKTDSGENYYVSYRVPLGLDATNLEGGYQYCTAVHTWGGGMGLTWVAAMLGDGQTFSDATNGVTITMVGHDATTSTVQVALQIPAKPIAKVSTSSLRGKAPLTVTFDGSASYDPDGSIVSWQWWMPGGTSITGTNQVSWTFTSSGTYYVTLTVTDNSGLTASTNVKVRIR
jgi:PKD repeat protein